MVDLLVGVVHLAAEVAAVAVEGDPGEVFAAAAEEAFERCWRDREVYWKMCRRVEVDQMGEVVEMVEMVWMVVVVCLMVVKEVAVRRLCR